MFTYFSCQNIRYTHSIAHKLRLIICNSLNIWVSSKKRRNTTDGEESTESNIMDDDEYEGQVNLNQMVRAMSFDTDSLFNDMANRDSESDELSKVTDFNSIQL